VPHEEGRAVPGEHSLCEAFDLPISTTSHIARPSLTAYFNILDRVEFFGVKLEGFHFTEHGWVQSYGSRYVRPPIIYADVKFTAPMTTKEFKYAQSLTEKPVKGMLTGVFPPPSLSYRPTKASSNRYAACRDRSFFRKVCVEEYVE
jgi:hypothetical protein